jgi:hypothetical protein
VWGHPLLWFVKFRFGELREADAEMRIRTALREFDWKGWLGWMTATMVGVQLVALILFLAGEVKLVDHWWGALTTLSMAGISIGICQWVWLRRRIVHGGWWILSTLSGWFLVWALLFLWDDSNANGVLSGLMVAIRLLAIPVAFSLPQWFLMRRQFQRAAWWWIVARPIAWLAGVGLIVLAEWLNILDVDIFELTYISVSTFVWIQMNQAVPEKERVTAEKCVSASSVTASKPI